MAPPSGSQDAVTKFILNLGREAPYCDQRAIGVRFEAFTHCTFMPKTTKNKANKQDFCVDFMLPKMLFNCLFWFVDSLSVLMLKVIIFEQMLILQKNRVIKPEQTHFLNNYLTVSACYYWQQFV